jgi:hypothetical protein
LEVFGYSSHVVIHGQGDRILFTFK